MQLHRRDKHLAAPTDDRRVRLELGPRGRGAPDAAESSGDGRGGRPERLRVRSPCMSVCPYACMVQAVNSVLLVARPMSAVACCVLRVACRVVCGARTKHYVRTCGRGSAAHVVPVHMLDSPGTGERDRYAQLEDGFSSEFEFVAPLLLLWCCAPAEYSPSTLSPSVLLQRRVLQVRSGWRAAHRALQPAEQRLARRGAHTGRRQWIGCALARAYACRRCGEARGIALDSSDTRVVRSTF